MFKHICYDGGMGSSSLLITPTSRPLTLRDRLDLLEQRCAELWAAEPVAADRRETAFSQLSDVEHRVVALILKSLAEPDDPALIAGAERCEQDLEQLGVLWTAPRAA